MLKFLEHRSMILFIMPMIHWSLTGIDLELSMES